MATPVHLFPSASDARGHQGFARVINHSARAGQVSIRAFDDGGSPRGPLTLAIGANETVHFNSGDLEAGNARKGLSGGTGPGEGHWRLELSSGLDIEVLSYVRTADGFLTAMHDAAPEEGNRRRVAFFNPGSNRNQISRLRLVNPGGEAAEVSIAGVTTRARRRGRARRRWCRRAGRGRTRRRSWSRGTRRVCRARSATGPASGGWWGSRGGRWSREPACRARRGI